MRKLVFATNNANKLREIREIVGNRYEILSLSDVGIHEDIPEEFDTLEKNSYEKAQFVFERTQMDCFADDTGLEVDALGGEPGVHSARYAEGTDHDSEANMQKLLQKLGNNNNRHARFRTIITFIHRDASAEGLITSQVTQFEGKVEGDIAMSKHGTAGFGYDPLFIPQGSAESFAELGEEAKNKISHRARAVKKFATYLKILDLQNQIKDIEAEISHLKKEIL